MKSAGGCITCEDARLLRWRGHVRILYAIAAIAIMVIGGGTRMKYAMVVFLLLAANAQAAPKFELADGDRVVFIGNTFTERDIQHNYLETLLTITYADRNVTFRNMGWSGDTVFVPARAGSGPNKGIDLLVDYVK